MLDRFEIQLAPRVARLRERYGSIALGCPALQHVCDQLETALLCQSAEYWKRDLVSCLPVQVVIKTHNYYETAKYEPREMTVYDKK